MKKFFAAVLTALLFLSGCSNFLNGSGFKSQISGQVDLSKIQNDTDLPVIKSFSAALTQNNLDKGVLIPAGTFAELFSEDSESEDYEKHLSSSIYVKSTVFEETSAVKEFEVIEKMIRDGDGNDVSAVSIPVYSTTAENVFEKHFGSRTAVFSYSLSQNKSGVYEVSFRATDYFGNKSSEIITFTLINYNNPAQTVNFWNGQGINPDSDISADDYNEKVKHFYWNGIPACNWGKSVGEPYYSIPFDQFTYTIELSSDGKNFVPYKTEIIFDSENNWFTAKIDSLNPSAATYIKLTAYCGALFISENIYKVPCAPVPVYNLDGDLYYSASDYSGFDVKELYYYLFKNGSLTDNAPIDTDCISIYDTDYFELCGYLKDGSSRLYSLRQSYKAEDFGSKTYSPQSGGNPGVTISVEPCSSGSGLYRLTADFDEEFYNSTGTKNFYINGDLYIVQGLHQDFVFPVNDSHIEIDLEYISGENVFWFNVYNNDSVDNSSALSVTKSSSVTKTRSSFNGIKVTPSASDLLQQENGKYRVNYYYVPFDTSWTDMGNNYDFLKPEQIRQYPYISVLYDSLTDDFVDIPLTGVPNGTYLICPEIFDKYGNSFCHASFKETVNNLSTGVTAIVEAGETLTFKCLISRTSMAIYYFYAEYFDSASKTWKSIVSDKRAESGQGFRYGIFEDSTYDKFQNRFVRGYFKSGTSYTASATAYFPDSPVSSGVVSVLDGKSPAVITDQTCLVQVFSSLEDCEDNAKKWMNCGHEIYTDVLSSIKNIEIDESILMPLSYYKIIVTGSDGSTAVSKTYQVK